MNPPRPSRLRNPIISGFNPDPSIVRLGDDYFLATSTFEFFPGVPIYHSKDLVEWSLIGHCLTRSSQLDLRTAECSMGVFAPSLRHWKGRFYMTTMAMHRRGTMEEMGLTRGFYVWTEDIWNSSSWSDPIYFDVLGIDQDLFHDETSGKTFLSLGRFLGDDVPDHKGFPLGVYTGEIDLDSGRSLSEFQLVRASSAGNGCGEGPHIFKRGDYYYLITAEGGTEVAHQEWVQRSKVGPMGPWELGQEGVINPLVYNGEHSEVRQTGHMDMVEGKDGRWWAVFLAVRPVQAPDGEMRLSQLGRETFLAPVDWVDDWPVVNKRQPITINMDVDLPRSSETLEEVINFSPERNLFKDGWYRLRTPLKVDYSLAERVGSLTLHGGPHAITENEAPTIFLRKQLSFTGRWTVTVDAKPQVGHSAGISIWYSRYCHASAFIRGTEGGRDVVYRFPNLSNDDFEEERTAIDFDGPLTFVVNAEPHEYTFSLEILSGTIQLGKLSSALLVRTREFDSIMTGTQLALWAAGMKGQGSLRAAHFSNVTYRGTRAGGD